MCALIVNMYYASTGLLFDAVPSSGLTGGLCAAVF